LLVAAVALLLTSCDAEAQPMTLIPFVYGESYGFFDESTEEVIIEPEFSRAWPRDDVGVVYGKASDNQWQAFNDRGVLVTTFNTPHVAPLTNGTVMVLAESGTDLATYDGKVLIEALSAVTHAWDGQIAVRFRSLGWTIVDSEGNKAFGEQYYTNIHPFSEGYAVAEFGRDGFALIDETGTPVFDHRFARTGLRLSEGLQIGRASCRERV